MSYNSSNFLQPLGSSKNIKILDNYGNLTFTIKPNLILDSFPDSNYLKILLKSGKEVKLDFLNIEDPILANTKLQQQIQFLLLNNTYDNTSATQSIATNSSVTGDFYQYDNFLRPLTESDRNIKILKNLIVKYTIDPFSIINTSVSSNILNIAVKSERAISLDFSTHNEARLALIRLREQIDLLINKTPLLIDKDIANYIDSKLFSVPTGTNTYKVFTALISQSGDNSLLNLPIGSSFEIGRTYTIDSYVAGDNFTNIGATQNATGSVFIATGATPSTWVDNDKNTTSILYTSGSPVVKILENTLGDVWFEYITTGQYSLKSNQLFTDNKTTITIGSEGYSGDYNRNINISREDSNSSQIFIEAYSDTTLSDGLLYYTTIEVKVYN